MRSILEKAIVHLLNEEQSKAEQLFHQFMVERARQIHTNLLQGDEAVLAEGWENELNADEYFADDDLNDLTDDGEGHADMDDDTMAGDDMAGDDVDGDMGDDTDTDMGDEYGDEDGMDDNVDGGDNSEVIDRLDSIEDQIEKLTAEFEAMMNDEGFDDNAEGEGDFGGETGDTDGADAEGEDDFGDENDNDNAKDDVPADGEETEEDKTVDESDDWDDITESVLSELEKVMVSADTDGKEVGAGKTITGNKTSALPQKKVNARGDGKPVMSKSSGNPKNFDRETAPAVKDMPKRKNTRKDAEQFRSKVPEKGDKSALLNKDFAGKGPNDKSVID